MPQFDSVFLKIVQAFDFYILISYNMHIPAVQHLQIRHDIFFEFFLPFFGVGWRASKNSNISNSNKAVR